MASHVDDNEANGVASTATGPASGRSGSGHSRFDPHFTQSVVDSMGENVTPRNRRVLGSLIRHLHDFVREVELTNDEWLAGMHFVNAVGQISTAIRNETRRVSDVLGLESLIVEIANKVVTNGDTEPTSSAILGPFWSPDAPFRPNGGSIIQDPCPDSRVCRMHGTITDLLTGEPIPGAVFDVWQASANGKYDFQDPDNQSPNNLRGKFRADERGHYSLYCYHPTAYSLPADGPAFDLLRLMDKDIGRPAHIHIMVTHPEYRGCTTQIYPRNDPCLSTDPVLSVKDDLVVDFAPLEGDASATLQLEYNVILSPKGYEGK